MLFDAKPYCVASEARDMQPDYFRMDFCYYPYTAEKVLNIVNKLVKFDDVSNCIKGNFINNNI